MEWARMLDTYRRPRAPRASFSPDMLVLTHRSGDKITFTFPDGTQAHALVTIITDRTVRIVYDLPETIRVGRDSTSAERAFKGFKP